MNTLKSKLLLGLIALLALGSCSEIDTSDKTIDMEQNVNIKHKWQEQLQNAMNNANYNHELKLVDYSEIGIINTEKEKKDYLDRIFDSKSYLSFLNDSESGYSIGTRTELQENYALEDNFFEILEDDISSKIIISQTRLLKLHWEYKGIKITTEAVALDNEALTQSHHQHLIQEKIYQESSVEQLRDTKN